MLSALRKPKALKAGDTLAVVSPSWGGAGKFPYRYQAGKRQLMEAFNVNVVETRHALRSPEWLVSNPQARAADLMEAFSDPSIDGIICAIGGDDSIRITPFLDLDVIRANPKVFMGYSDITALHFSCIKAGLVSFYGPSILSGFAENDGLLPYTEKFVRKTLFNTAAVGRIDASPSYIRTCPDWSVPENQHLKRTPLPTVGRRILQGNGCATGPLIGGCVDAFPMLMGTDVWPEKSDFNGAILFLEIASESPSVSSIKRIFRGLGAQGIFDDLNGIVMGRTGGEISPEQTRAYEDALHDIVNHEFGNTTLPIMAQMDFGHTDPMFILPYGVKARLDCQSKDFFLLENAVI